MEVFIIMTDVSPEALQRAKIKLKDLTKTWQTGVCRGVCLYLDSSEMVVGHGACHSWVNQAYGRISGRGYGYSWTPTYPKDAKPFLTLSCHSKEISKGKCSPEAVDAIILWMARESPFSKFVLNRDDEDSLLNGGVILLCGPGGLTPAQALWVCKVLRYSTEGAQALDIWLELYKGGVNPLLAVLVCSLVRTVKGATFGFTGYEGHSTVFINYGDRTPNVPSLISGTLNPKAECTADVFDNPKVKSKRGKLGKQRSVEATIKGFCKPLQIDDGWGGKVVSNGANGPEFIKRVLEWQHENEPEGATDRIPSRDTVYLDLDL
jgi:hypothetical protein